MFTYVYINLKNIKCTKCRGIRNQIKVEKNEINIKRNECGAAETFRHEDPSERYRAWIQNPVPDVVFYSRRRI